eukprot:TRINITY_DN5851_c0_g1_i1.p1 TRINITY_DN5851_c0_g1~~TRINITY_DN5851_c0_g1_i1.p1  ORF type:complete len:260 (-),score=36.98 TRINITY_DN5851_c0_g1_i1:130-879(-)
MKVTPIRRHAETTGFDRFFTLITIATCVLVLLSAVLGGSVVPRWMPQSLAIIVHYAWCSWMMFCSFYYPLWIKYLSWPEPTTGVRQLFVWQGIALLWAIITTTLFGGASEFFLLFVAGGVASYLAASVLHKTERKIWQKYCAEKSYKLPWDHWTWDWAEKKRRLLNEYIAKHPESDEDSIRQVVLSLLNYHFTDKEGVVHWENGEEWRGLIEWARHEGIEANIAADVRTQKRLFHITGLIAQKFLKKQH